MSQTGSKIPEGSSAALIMADGKIFYGKAIGAHHTSIGEICFNTSLTGYQEILTDPSYAGQIITFTFPHIGNVGVNEEDVESFNPVARGLIIREDITNPSSFRSKAHFAKWLKDKKIAGICGVDTRAITRHVRVNGAQNVAIYHFSKDKADISGVLEKVKAYPSLKGMELAATVTCAEQYTWDKTVWAFQAYPSASAERLGGGQNEKGSEAPTQPPTLEREGGHKKYKVVAIDYGMKLNILRCLVSVGFDVKVVPAKTSAEEILKMQPDGIFLSNGPGDPAATGEYAMPILKKLIDSNIPIFGICLGHQLLARALGCATTKMHQGHRGANHPVQDLQTKKVEITSQNHGFVVAKNALPEDVEITHLSLFDNTIEGIKSKTRPVFSVQYHPESSPGPHDSFYLFERFVGLMK
jgi:carbamoyl-phosphate synthase small subunit